MTVKRGEDEECCDEVVQHLPRGPTEAPPLQICLIEDMMEGCDGDEIASEHQSNEGGTSTQRATKLRAHGTSFSENCSLHPNRPYQALCEDDQCMLCLDCILE